MKTFVKMSALLAALIVIPVLLFSVPRFPRFVLSPTTLTFPAQVVSPTGPPGTAQTLTLRNSGNGAGIVGAITVTGLYSQTNNCPTSLVASASCTIEVTFAPNAVGNINGTVHVGAGAVRSSLTGTGLAPVGFSPDKLDFGTVAVGSTATAQNVTLTNNQGAALAIQSISASGDYSQSNNCPTSLAAGATCTLSVSFQPTVKGKLAGAISVDTDAPLAAQPVGLTGVGSGTTIGSVSFTPASLDFGAREASTTSPGQTVILKNTSSSSSLTVTSVAASAGYGTTDTCAGHVIAPNGTCTITATFQPTANLVPISYPGAITVVDGDSTSPHVIGLSGSSVAPVSSSPASLDFGTVVFNATSGTQTITLTNYDSAAETLSTATSGVFGVAGNTCTSLAPGAKCTIGVTFGPGLTGPATGVMSATFSSGGFLNPHIVNLAGCLTEVVRTPQNLNFGAVGIGQTSAPETATISGGAFNFTGFALSGTNAADFAIANNTCGNALSGGSCTLDVTFAPTAAGTRTASLDIADDQHCSPQSVKLVGGSSAGPFVLTGILNGSGSGNLTSNPAGLDCGSQNTNCSADFPTGSAVTVSAAPDPNSTFNGWSGACSGTGACNLSMNADRQVTATFNVKPLLSVSLAGNLSGTGTVASNPPGINCQNPPQATSVCQAYFLPGSSVQLAATPGPGSVFAGWDTACSGTASCTITMNADQSVGATFNGPPTVNVGLVGTGSGTVTSTPAGINCPAAQCSSTFPSGTPVTLTATPGSGSGFDGWSGPCTGAGSCSFHVTSDQSVGATFDLPDFAVNVSPLEAPTIVPGGRATFSIAIGGQGGFNTAVSLQCTSPSAQGVNCSLSTTSVKPGGSASLTVTTTGPSAAVTPLPGSTRSSPLYAIWIFFPALVVMGIGSAGSRSKRRRLALWLSCLLLLSLLGLQMACSSGSGMSNPGTPAGTYTVVINATSGTTLQHSTSVNVIVQ